MKNIVTIFLAIFSLSLSAQNLTLSQDTVYLRFGQIIDYGDYIITNNSSREIDIDCTIKPICYDSNDDTQIFICFGSLCFAPITTETTYGDLTQEALISIPAGSGDNSFKFDPDSSEEFGSTWEITFFNRNDPDDKATLIVYVSSCQLSNTKEAYDKLGFTLFPNPVLTSLNLDFVSSISEKKVVIYDYSGQILLTDVVGSGISSYSKDINELGSGFYFVEISDDSGLRFVKKLSKF